MGAPLFTGRENTREGRPRPRKKKRHARSARTRSRQNNRAGKEWRPLPIPGLAPFLPWPSTNGQCLFLVSCFFGGGCGAKETSGRETDRRDRAPWFFFTKCKRTAIEMDYANDGSFAEAGGRSVSAAGACHSVHRSHVSASNNNNVAGLVTPMPGASAQVAAAFEAINQAGGYVSAPTQTDPNTLFRHKKKNKYKHSARAWLLYVCAHSGLSVSKDRRRPDATRAIQSGTTVATSSRNLCATCPSYGPRSCMI